ncbi:MULTISPECIES: CDP-glycerol glycerophosphotransferase family protein [Bacillus]|nr:MULTISPECIES: CDP-glycerol glycerophosphotransferase family protein [Bacillus]MDF9666968.1 CDP-glycerol glycerophosphotransferase family protein [Bacillus wiedmannii]PFZ28082.1 hypothetical protein COL51_08685 [Bacillus wiedmannii]PGC19053.1 hypothetical protein COM08_10960 [Bacillus wiedmannii]PGC54454.1 hypothetical protein COM22_19500 [Bacillus wiedmannii]HDR7867671.1 CDP-glycerol glycerophosphotransferase family protein [Bacillus wiedmannii]
MNFLRFLWLPKEQGHCVLQEIKYSQQKLNIVLRMEGITRNLGLDKYYFILVNRKSKEEIKVCANIQNNTDLLDAQVELNDYIESLAKGIWDAYLQIEVGGKINKFRVKNDVTDAIEFSPFYIKELNKIFIGYSTVKGNLSFKSQESSAYLDVEVINLKENGVLELSGYFLMLPWNTREETEITKKIVMRSENNTWKIPVNNVKRTDVTAFYGQSGGSYDWTGFSVQLDFRKNTYGLENNKSTQIFIEMEYKEEVVLLPVIISPNMVFNNCAIINTLEGIKKVLFSTDRENNQGYILLTREDLQAEVNCIYSEDNQITIVGEVIQQQMVEKFSEEPTSLIIKKRNTEEKYEFEIELDGFNYAHTFNLEDLVSKGLFGKGIWDIYLKVNKHSYRLVTRLDGVANKQKVINIPQQLLSDLEGRAIVIKPYYTLHDEVSILVREYLNVKSIQEVKIEKDAWIVSGKLNIQTPNKIIPVQTNGSMTIKGSYGKRNKIPVIWNLEKNEKTKQEFKFRAILDLSTIQQGEERDKLLTDINFDLIECEFKLNGGIALFTMNIDPSKIILTLEDRLKQIIRIRKFINKWDKSLYRIFNRILPINQKYIIFQSFHGKSYSCNPRAIYEQMLIEKRDMKAIWIVNNIMQEIPGKPIVVKPGSVKYYYYMAKSKYFVNNGNFPDFYEKRKGTVHLQTWHGTPLKKLGFDIDPNSPSYAENTSPALLRRNERWDYLIGPNNYTSKILKRAFNFEKIMLDVGYPRNDIFYNKDIDKKSDEIKKRLNIDPKKKIILYAPTWRDYDFHNGNQHKPYEFKFDLNKFKEKFGEEYVLLLRLHYRDATRIQINGLEEFVYNVSSYNDIQELYLISDMLITDYSSVMFDFANLNRPIIFFTYDLFRYGSQIRGFYVNFQEEAPGPIILNQERLFKTIEDISKVEAKYAERYKKFQDKFCHLEDGRASKRTIEAMIGK